MVTRARIDWGASAVIFAGLLALIVDMFLGWVKVTVYYAGLFGTPLTFDMRLTGSGWAGWGIVGGFLAVVLVFWHARSIKRRTVSVGGAAGHGPPRCRDRRVHDLARTDRRDRRYRRRGALHHRDQAVARRGSDRVGAGNPDFRPPQANEVRDGSVCLNPPRPWR